MPRYIECTCESARMGVSTALVVGDKATRLEAAKHLRSIAADAELTTYGIVEVWVFKSGGELFLSSNSGASRSVYRRRHPRGTEPLEIVYPRDADV